MSKARTKARKLSDKRRRQSSGMDIAPTPKRKSRGSARMAEIRHEADADIPALMARCRHQGKAASEDSMADAKRPWHGCEAGKAMARHVDDDATRSRLWDAIQHMRRVFSAYDTAMGAPSRHAQCLRVMTPPDAMATNAAAPPLDLRDEVTKYRDAINGLITLDGWLQSCPHGHEAKGVVVDDRPCRNPLGLIDTLHEVSRRITGTK